MSVMPQHKKKPFDSNTLLTVQIKAKKPAEIISLFLFQDLQRLNCEHRTENDTRVVVCDLGNPMMADTSVRNYFSKVICTVKP